MCIENSVGRIGVNQKVDVKIVQILLNLAINELLPRRVLSENGRYDSGLVEGIEAVQQRARIPVTGLVETESPTLAYLRQLLPEGISQAKLQGIMAGAPAQTIAKYYTSLTAAMRRYDITTAKRMKHFLAQIGHESGQLMWCSEFASGDAYGRTSERIGQYTTRRRSPVQRSRAHSDHWAFELHRVQPNGGH